MPFSNDSVVQVIDASIFQEDQCIFNNISFSIDKGEFVYLIGRTGSGKSSLLKTLYADLPLKLGHVQVAGYHIKDIKRTDVPFLRRKTGIVFQDFELFYDRTIAENLEFVMRATGWKNKAKMKVRMAEVMMQVGLVAVNNKMPHQLSGGEQQRVVVARSLINEPQILLADEPTGNLDPTVSEEIFKLFLDINKSGTAVFMATHNHFFIKKFPARVLKCETEKLLDSSKQKFKFSSWY